MFSACMSVMAQVDTSATLPTGSTTFTPSFRWQDFGGKQLIWEFNSAKGKYYLVPTVQYTRFNFGQLNGGNTWLGNQTFSNSLFMGGVSPLTGRSYYSIEANGQANTEFVIGDATVTNQTIPLFGLRLGGDRGQNGAPAGRFPYSIEGRDYGLEITIPGINANIAGQTPNHFSITNAGRTGRYFYVDNTGVIKIAAPVASTNGTDSILVKATDGTIKKIAQNAVSSGGTVTNVNSSTSDITVTNPTTTPTLNLPTLNGITKSYYDVSSSIQTQLNGKQAGLGFTPENVANKATSLASPDNTKYPTTQAVATAIAAIPVYTSSGGITKTSNNFTLDPTYSPTWVNETLTGNSSAVSYSATGTDGSGNITLPTQSAKPSTPTSGIKLYNLNGPSWITSNGFSRTLNWATVTADRVATFPDASFTVAGVDLTQTFTNKTISGANNTFSNIPNSGLTNSSFFIGTSQATSTSLGGTIPDASLTQAGVVNIGSQVFSGAKTFANAVGFNSSINVGLASNFSTIINSKNGNAATSTATQRSSTLHTFTTSMWNGTTATDTYDLIYDLASITTNGVRSLNFLMGSTNSQTPTGGITAMTIGQDGVVSTITPTVGTNNTQVATTAFVNTAIANTGRTPVLVTSNQTMILSSDYLNTSATQYTLTLPPTTGFAADGSKIITGLSTGTGGIRISVPSGYSLQTPAGNATTTGTGGATITQNQKYQLIPITTNGYYLQVLNGTATVN